jgi:hypothetical protein
VVCVAAAQQKLEIEARGIKLHHTVFEQAEATMAR